jgi:uncharacterized membrane protein (UPF0127 family)
MKKIFALTLISNLLCFTVFSKSLPKKILTLTNSEQKSIQINAEIADDEKEREHGYMFRKKIPEGTGMLFIFEQDQILSFWMKNTPHPLSIAYIDSKGRIRNIFDMTPYSLSPIVSSYSVRYALEVPQGWFKKQNIQIGDQLELDFIN